MKTLKYLRSKLLELLTHKIALPLISKFRKRPPFLYSMDQLLNFPEGTLGKDLALYLTKKNFSLLPNYERHDCKHIILGYEMDEEGEARMQFYFLGNRRYSIPVIMTVIICFALMPEYWSIFYMEFKKGRRTKTFDNVDFNKAVLQNTIELKIQFTNEK
jgi:ubiquinone biosynthesis protein Coq4